MHFWINGNESGMSLPAFTVSLCVLLILLLVALIFEKKYPGFTDSLYKKRGTLCAKCEYMRYWQHDYVYMCSYFNPKKCLRRRRVWCPNKPTDLTGSGTEPAKPPIHPYVFGGIIIGVLVVALVAMLCIDVLTENKVHESAESERVYESLIAQSECRLCSDELGTDNPTGLHLHWGEKNIAFLNLNTFDNYLVGINQYDAFGEIIGEKVGYFSSAGLSSKDEGSWLSCYTMIDRGFAHGQIVFGKNSKVDPAKLANYLCQTCLNEVMDSFGRDKAQWDIALVNLETREIEPIRSDMSGFSTWDYYFDYDYNKEKNYISYFLVYCPIRYE